MFIYNRYSLFKFVLYVVVVLHGEFKAIFYILFIFKTKGVYDKWEFFHPVKILLLFTSFTNIPSNFSIKYIVIQIGKY